MLIGLFIVVYSFYDAHDGEFQIASQYGGGRMIYRVDNPSAYQTSVIEQSLLGLGAIGLGSIVWQKGKK